MLNVVPPAVAVNLHPLNQPVVAQVLIADLSVELTTLLVVQSTIVSADCVQVWLALFFRLASVSFAVAQVAIPASLVLSVAKKALLVVPSVIVSADCVPVWLALASKVASALFAVAPVAIQASLVFSV